MKLTEAIEILQFHSERNADVAGSDWANALKLGIEALKRLNELRTPSGGDSMLLLQGETKE